MENVVFVALDGHRKGLTELQIESMRLLDEPNGAVWPVLLHASNQQLRFFGGVVHRHLGGLHVLLAFHLLLGFKCTYRLENGHIQRGLAVLIQHEEVMGKVGQLGLEVVPVWLLEDKLVYGRVAFLVDAVVMRID